MSLPLLVEVVRSGHVESTHTGSVLAVGPGGEQVVARGDLTHPVFPRSSNKPLQAVAMLQAGWVPGDQEQLALATASHSGEAAHLDVVRRILGPFGEGALGCPASLPLSEAAAHGALARGGGPTRLQMNCSGKHAAMLATCRANGWPSEDYLLPEHPLQLAITAGIERLAGEPVRHLAVDGCGAPQHALSLTGLARAFGAIASAVRGEEQQVADAMRANPFLVGGTGRDVTLLMEGLPGIVAKDGAEGVYACGLADGSAVALKIEDGAARARTPVLVGALRVLGVAGDVLDELAASPVHGGGAVVGEIRAVQQTAAD